MDYLQDKKILRRLAAEYMQYATDSQNQQAISLHRGINDLKPVRPILLIDEIPWNEMDFDQSLTLGCKNPVLRRYETELRRSIFRWKHLRGDMALPTFLGVQKHIHSTGIGVEVLEETRMTEGDNHIISHKYETQFETMSDLEQLHNPIITYDEQATNEEFYMLGDIIGDIMPVKKVGEATGYGLGCKSWDIISTYMSIDTLLYNLIDRPEFMHALAKKLADIFANTVEQYEKLNLLDGDALYNHCTAATASDLHVDEMDREKVSTKNVWGRGLAQILATVSPDMHDEFDITYMIDAMKPFGLVYYGCCEPLDRKISILEQIPNLRKISISPWANIELSAEAIQKKYVLSAKPNPANVAVDQLDESQIKKELSHILQASEQFGCPCELVLKDISTVKHHPENLIRWHDIAMSLL